MHASLQVSGLVERSGAMALYLSESSRENERGSKRTGKGRVASRSFTSRTTFVISAIVSPHAGAEFRGKAVRVVLHPVVVQGDDEDVVVEHLDGATNVRCDLRGMMRHSRCAVRSAIA